MQGPNQHGVGTWLPAITAIVIALGGLLQELAVIDWTLNWTTLAGILLPVLIVSWGKFAQAVEQIRNGGSAVVLEAPEPDLDIPDGEPEGVA